MNEDIHELMRRVQAHPDYVYATLWTREDVAVGAHGGDEATPEQVAAVTLEQMREAGEWLARWVFGDHGYDWMDAIRDALEALAES